MRPREAATAAHLEAGLIAFDRNREPLPGLAHGARRATLIEQMVESNRRVAYVSSILQRNISERRADPNDLLFDPLKAAILKQRAGQTDEAYWLIFYFVHFGKHSRAGWRYAREVYGRLGAPGRWDWPTTSADVDAFCDWLRASLAQLNRDGEPRGFGNHRKYESLTATCDAVRDYVAWIAPPRTHDQLFQSALNAAHGDGRRAFDDLYKSMRIERFGRTARFDYLTMIGKLGLCAIEPGSAYLSSATGPLAGARLLFDSAEPPAVLDRRLVELGTALGLGMQVIEDALCNWQKSPDQFVAFRE